MGRSFSKITLLLLSFWPPVVQCPDLRSASFHDRESPPLLQGRPLAGSLDYFVGNNDLGLTTTLRLSCLSLFALCTDVILYQGLHLLCPETNHQYGDSFLLAVLRRRPLHFSFLIGYASLQTLSSSSHIGLVYLNFAVKMPVSFLGQYRNSRRKNSRKRNPFTLLVFRLRHNHYHVRWSQPSQSRLSILPNVRCLSLTARVPNLLSILGRSNAQRLSRS